MANYQILKADIDAKVYQNGQQEITGAKLNSVLNAMVTTLGAEYQFAGVATTATNPGTPDAKVFYIANGKGIYTNFGSLEVTEDEVVVLYWDTAWHKEATGIASNEKLTELESDIADINQMNVTGIAGAMQQNGGISTTSTSCVATYDFIPCKSGQIVEVVGKPIVIDGVKYYASNYRMMAYSDKNADSHFDIFFVFNGQNGKAEIPSGALYYRASVAYINADGNYYNGVIPSNIAINALIVKGYPNSVNERLDKKIDKVENSKNGNLPIFKEGNLEDSNTSIEDINQSIITNTIQIKNQQFTDADKGYISSNGTKSAYSGDIYVTKFINVENISHVLVLVSDTEGRNTAFYTEDNESAFIQGSYSTPSASAPNEYLSIDVPSGAKYCRITIKQQDISNLVIKLKAKGFDSDSMLDYAIDNASFAAFQKFGVIGDSLSVGHVYANGVHHSRNIWHSWGQHIARKFGNICLNFGHSGATTKTWFTYADCYETLAKEENRCQAYIIGIGTNDESTNIGSLSDINVNYTQNADTFYGRFAKIIQAVKAFAPMAKIFVFTIPHPREDDGKNSAIRNICNMDSIKENVFLIDLEGKHNALFEKSALTQNYIGDHFTPVGYSMIAEIIQKLISDNMNQHPADFRNITLIPFGDNNVVG